MRVPAANLESLLAKLKNQYVNKNEVVFRENDPGDCYYIVAEGRFAVSKKSPAGEMVLSELGPGDIFGEDALVANTTRSATVTALVQGHLKALSKKHFEELLKPPMLNSISWGQAFALIKKGAVPLDVRTEEEFEQDKRKWAVNLPLYLLRLKLRLGSKLLTPEKRYVVFCDTGQRSAVVAYILAQNDITSYVVEGGLGSLKLSDGP